MQKSISDHMLRPKHVSSQQNVTINVHESLQPQMQFLEERVDQLNELVEKVCSIFFQSKGHFFNRMLELKRSMNDPQRIDTDVSRALGLAFDHRDLSGLVAQRDSSQSGQNRSRKERLKINSEQQISLEEKNQFSSGEAEQLHDALFEAYDR